MENTFEKKIIINSANKLSEKLENIIESVKNADGTTSKRLKLSKKADFKSENQFDIYKAELVFAIRDMTSCYDERSNAEAMNKARKHLESAVDTLFENADITCNYNIVGKDTVRFFSQAIGIKMTYSTDGKITFTEASVSIIKKLLELLVYSEINGKDFYEVEESASNSKVLSAKKKHEEAEAKKAAKKAEAEAKKANKAKAEADAKANRETVEAAVAEAKAAVEEAKAEADDKANYDTIEAAVAEAKAAFEEAKAEAEAVAAVAEWIKSGKVSDDV